MVEVKTTEIKVTDIKDILAMVECQRDISVRLSIIVENQRRMNEQLKIVKGQSQKLAMLKQKHSKAFRELKTLTEDEVKEVNKLLRDRYIKI